MQVLLGDRIARGSRRGIRGRRTVARRTALTGGGNVRWTLLGTACLLALPATANAYVDPGTGSYLVQFLIAGVLGAMAVVRLYWTRITAGLRSVMRRNRREPVDGR